MPLMDFTLKEYRQLIRALKESGYDAVKYFYSK